MSEELRYYVVNLPINKYEFIMADNELFTRDEAFELLRTCPQAGITCVCLDSGRLYGSFGCCRTSEVR